MRWLIVGAALITLAGCKQGVGDRCQVQSDCEDGLLCILPAGGTPQSGGICQSPNNTDGGFVADFAANTDLTATPVPDLRETDQ
jgi:Carboxypeptidase A inhibitor